MSRTGTHQIIARTLRHPLEQARGQMLRTIIQPQLFVLKRSCALLVHTFFVMHCIDIIFIDNARTITRIETIKPWRIIYGRAQYLLELPGGSTPYRVGDTLTFKP